MIKFLKRLIKALLLILCTGLIFIFGISFYIKKSADSHILSLEDASQLEDIDCILVLGAGIKGNKTSSPMLAERLDLGVDLYNSGVCNKLLMSGDHAQDNYNEVQVMKDYAAAQNIPTEDIFMDHAGFSTYDSVYRAKEVFQAQKVLIVSQKYHLPRALYLARRMGLEAYGIPADTKRYKGQALRDFREILARDKDFITGILKPSPKYMGNSIPVNGNGNVTND